MKQIINFTIFMAICYVSYLLFNNLNYNINYREGMETESSNNGVAGNAAEYASAIKTNVIKIQDMLLISKYRNDYENVVLNMDDLVNNLMLKATLSIDKTKPHEGLKILVGLNEAKSALNNVMKFIDSSK
jgi:hypothetical protein